MTVEILVTVPFTEAQQNRLRGISPKLNFSFLPAARLGDVPAETWARAEVLYTGHLLPDPEQVPVLKWVQFHYAGIDRFVDEPVLQKNGLLITTLSGAAASQAAEHALGMLLALGRKLPMLLALQKKGEWPRDRFEKFTPVELRGATVGIVGYGSIGRQVARLLHTFGATVLAAKRDAMQPADPGYTQEGLGDPRGEYATRIYPIQALRSMLKECRFVVITAPLTSQTRNLMNADMLDALPPGALLVDISRGGILDHAALVHSLKEGNLAGAALDVFPEEPLPVNSPLWQLPNIIITPHLSGGSVFYGERAVGLFSENLLRYLGGLPLYNLFDLERGY
jgi:phosphoglycerate dehydrogenase-like enzyme